MPTHYQTLGIPETASLPEIKSAFRKLSLRYHPDRNNGDKQSEEIFRGILDAYKVLSDPDQKHWYDQQLYYSRQPRQDYYQSPQGQYTDQQNDSGHSYRSSYDQYTYAPPPPTVKPWYTRVPSQVLWIVIFVVCRMVCTDNERTYVPEFRVHTFDTAKNIAPIPSMVEKLAYVTLQDGSRASLEDMLRNESNASITQSMDDIDNDGVRELRFTITRPGQDQYTDRDIILKHTNSLQNAVLEEGKSYSKPNYQAFFDHTGGMYIVGNNIRLYFDAAVETYKSCGSCNVSGMPYKNNKPGIYLVANKGKLQFSRDYDYRNKILEESLIYLGSLGVPELENGQDGGIRKEYLRQVITYYFNNLSFEKTEKLFRKYYNGKDEDVVWKDTQSIIRNYAQKITSNAAFSNMEVF